METVFNEIQHSVKNWWTSLLLGIVYIIVALWLMFSPVSTYVALSIIFSVSMLISGILEILFAVSNRKGVPSWGCQKLNCRADHCRYLRRRNLCQKDSGKQPNRNTDQDRQKGSDDGG